MSEAILYRTEDPSGVSGTGAVAEIFEASDGAVAIRWTGEHPSWGLWPDMRDLEAIHGHGGKSLVQYLDPHRLLRAWEQTCFWLLSASEDKRPMWVGPHPQWPDRLLLRFRDERSWLFWTALLDGSPNAATHEQVGGELVSTWVNPAGDLWLTWSRPGTYEDLLDGETYDEHPLTTFDREDR